MSQSAKKENLEAKPQVGTWTVDITAEQRLSLGGGMFAVMNTYPDTHWKMRRDEFWKYINSLNLDEDSEAANLEKFKHNFEQDYELFKILCKTIDGVELPENWKNEFAPEDARKLVTMITNFVIDEDTRKFNPFAKEITVPTACLFNGKPAKQIHTLKRQTIDLSSRYSHIKSKQLKYDETLERNLVIPQEESKAELYDEMFISQTGFKDGNIPVRVKAMVIDWVFAPSIPEKK